MKIKVNKKELAMIVDALASFNGRNYKSEKQRATFYALFGRLGAILDTPKRVNFGPDCYAERKGTGWVAVYKGEILGSGEPRSFEIARENCMTSLEGDGITYLEQTGLQEWPSDIEDMHAAWEAESERVKACDVIWGNCPDCGQYHTP